MSQQDEDYHQQSSFTETEDFCLSETNHRPLNHHKRNASNDQINQDPDPNIREIKVIGLSKSENRHDLRPSAQEGLFSGCFISS